MSTKFELTGLVPNLEDLTDKRGLANVVRMRSPDEVTCWVLHQNGFRWKPTNPLRDKIKAQFQIWECGKITQNAHILARLRSSSNGANAGAISIEFDGNFEGNPGRGNFYKPEKYGRHTLSQAQIVAARTLITTVNGMLPSIKRIFAHRQFGVSSKTGKPNRPICPGHNIWTEIGEWAKNEFDLTDGGPGWVFTLNGKQRGLPIPDDWRGIPTDFFVGEA